MFERIKTWFSKNPWAIWVGLGGAGVGVLYIVQQNASSSQSNSNAAQTDPSTTDTSLTDATGMGALSGDPTDISTGTGSIGGSFPTGTGTTISTPGLPTGPSGGVNLPSPTPSPIGTTVSNPDGDSTGSPAHVPTPATPVQTPAPVAAHRATHIGATPRPAPHPSASAHRPAPKKRTHAGPSTFRSQ